MEASTLQAPAGLARRGIAIGTPLLRLRSDEQLVALFRAGHDEAASSTTATRRGSSRTRGRSFPRARTPRIRFKRVRACVLWLSVRATVSSHCGHGFPRRPQPLHRRASPANATGSRGASAHRPDDPRPRRRGRGTRVAPPADRRRPPPSRPAALGTADAGDGWHVLQRARVHAGRCRCPPSALLVRARIALAQAAEARDTACCEIRGSWSAPTTAASVQRDGQASHARRLGVQKLQARTARRRSPARSARAARSDRIPREDARDLGGAGSGATATSGRAAAVCCSRRRGEWSAVCSPRRARGRLRPRRDAAGGGGRDRRRGGGDLRPAGPAEARPACRIATRAASMGISAAASSAQALDNRSSGRGGRRLAAGAVEGGGRCRGVAGDRATKPKHKPAHRTPRPIAPPDEQAVMTQQPSTPVPPTTPASSTPSVSTPVASGTTTSGATPPAETTTTPASIGADSTTDPGAGVHVHDDRHGSAGSTSTGSNTGSQTGGTTNTTNTKQRRLDTGQPRTTARAAAHRGPRQARAARPARASRIDNVELVEVGRSTATRRSSITKKWWCGVAAAGLFTFAAGHSTVRGQALGGCRMWAYDDSRGAFRDALRLSRRDDVQGGGRGLPLGGGKGVIIRRRMDRSPRIGATPRCSRRQVEALHGRYITAEDIGTVEPGHGGDRRAHRARRRYGEEPGGSGDPSPLTALGVEYRSGHAASGCSRAGRCGTGACRVIGLGHVG